MRERTVGTRQTLLRDTPPGERRPSGEALIASSIAFVPHPWFDRPDAAVRIERLRPAAADDPRDEDAADVMSATVARRLAFRLDLPLLSKGGEKHLFLRMNHLRWRAARLQDQWARGAASPANRERVEALVAESQTIRNHIAERNLRLVVSLARRAATPALPLDELVSECLPPLLRAVELYDVRHGYGFSTYATHAVRNAIGRALQRAGRRTQFATGDPQMLATAADARPDEARSIEEHAGDGALAARLLDRLAPRERTILEARYGLGPFDREHTFGEIGTMLKLSKERVRILAHRSIDTLQGIARCGDRA